MTPRLHSFCITLLLTLLCMVSGAAQATAIFSNFGAGNSYQTGTGLFVGDGNLDASANYAQASTFVASTSAKVGSIVIALGDFGFGQGAPITVSLLVSGVNKPGSTALENFIIGANTLGTFGNNNSPLTLTSVLHPLLTVGTQYWLSVSTSLANLVVWNFSDTDFLSYNAVSQSLDGGTTWDDPFGSTRGVFQINTFATVAVPEPATLILVAGGILGFAGLRRRRQSR
jgi:hypothetical protein